MVKDRPKILCKTEFRLPVPRGFSNYIKEALPDDLKNRHQDAAWIVSKITKFGMNRRDYGLFCPISSRIAESIVGKAYFAKFVRALVYAGVIESDGIYIPGVKSRGYRLTADYQICVEQRGLFWLSVTDKRLHKAIKRNRDDMLRKMSPVDRELRRFVMEISMDQEEAASIIKTEISKDHTKLSQEFAVQKCLDIANGPDRPYGIDFYGRRHTPITNMHKELRRSLRWKGKKLSEIDIKSSQPFILAILFRLISNHKKRQEFTNKLSLYKMRGDSLRSLTEVNHVGLNTPTNQGSAVLSQAAPVLAASVPVRGPADSRMGVTTGTTTHPPIMSPKLTQVLWQQVNEVSKKFTSAAEVLAKSPSDMSDFERSVCSGRIYDEIHERAFGIPLPTSDRGQFKEDFFRDVLYGQGKAPSKAKNAFKKAFPAVWEAIRLLKKPCWQAFPCLMQHIEAEFVVERAAKLFLDRNPGHFIATIHDSFLVVSEDIPEAQACLVASFADVGLRPSFSTTIRQ